MKEKWDSIIIGSGIGGLTAAACLVNRGLRVLVLERNPHIGGTAYVYHRGDFTFPMGPLGFSSSRVVKEILRAIGQGDYLELSPIRYKVHAFGLDVRISLPFQDLANELSRKIPGQKEQIERFFADMAAIIDAMQQHPTQNVDDEFLAKASGASAAKYLSECVSDWRLRRILGSTGTREPYSSLVILAAMWNLIAREGIYYPKLGMRPLCERLAGAVSGKSPQNEGAAEGNEYRNRRGFSEIVLNSDVKEIRVGEGKVQGVTLRNGAKLDAPVVISNADYRTTFLQLVDSKAVSPDWLAAVRAAKQTMSNIQVCLGCDASKVDLTTFHECSRIIYRRSGSEVADEGVPDWQAHEIVPVTLARQELEISLLSADDPSLCPRGCAVVIVRTEADYEHFARFHSGPRRRLAPYIEYKTRLAYALINEVENLLPNLSNSILVSDVATPLTYEERGGRSEGAVAGWSWNYEDNQDYAPRELVRTPIRGLYMAGYQAFSSLFLGGIPTAMESGRRAAEAALHGAEPSQDVLTLFKKS